MTIPDHMIEHLTALLPGPVGEELARRGPNGEVGHMLVAENERARVWTIRLEPGQRLPLHTHVKDYIWIALSAGRARSYVTDGVKVRQDEFELVPGANSYNRYAEGAFKMHDLENTGDTDLVFVTIEFADAPNPFLDVADEVRFSAPNGLVASIQIG